MKKYIVSKKHKSTNSFSASVVTATLLISTPMVLSADSTVLKDVDVVEKKEIDYTSNYKVDKSSSSKVVQDLLDTPQTISVVTNKVMKEQQATTLVDALKNTPGVTMFLGEGGNSNQKGNLSLRGFDVSSSIYKDGVRELSGATRDTFNTEAIEVTKGTVGADNGRSVASGYINQVSKTAKNKDNTELGVSYNTANNTRLTADLNKALSESSGVRLNVMKQDGDVPGRDGVEVDRLGIAASLAFGIGKDTRTTINYERYEQDDVPDGGVSTVGLNGYYNQTLANAGVNVKKVDPKNFYGSNQDFEKVTSDIFTAKFEHDFSDKLTLTNTTRYGKSNQEMLITAPGALVTATTGNNSNPNFNVNNPATWTVTRSGQTKWQENEILTNHINISTVAHTGSISHNISTGADVSIENQTTKTITRGGTANQANLYNPNSSNALSNLTLSENGAQTFGETKTVGVYAFDSINLTDKFIVTGGARLDKYNTQTDITSIATATNPGGGVPVGTKVATNLEDSGTLKSYKVGAVYKPLENGSIYISYADSQLPPGGANFALSSSETSASNSAMEPQKSVTTEFGTKWDLLDNRLSLSTAIYKTEVTNEVMTESDGSTSQNGEKEVKGIELGLVGEITDKWNISTGIAKSKTEVLRATNTNPANTQEGAALRFSPELTATLWTTYKVVPSVTFGAGARYVGKQYRSTSSSQQNDGSTTNMPEIESYVVYDAMASYQQNKNLSYQLNLYNLTDEEYVASMNNNGHRYTPGASRSALLSLAYKF